MTKMLTIDNTLGLITASLKLGQLMLVTIWMLVLMRMTTLIAVITTVLILCPSLLDCPLQVRVNRDWIAVVPAIPYTTAPPPPPTRFQRSQEERGNPEPQQTLSEDQLTGDPTTRVTISNTD